MTCPRESRVFRIFLCASTPSAPSNVPFSSFPFPPNTHILSFLKHRQIYHFTKARTTTISTKAPAMNSSLPVVVKRTSTIPADIAERVACIPSHSFAHTQTQPTDLASGAAVLTKLCPLPAFCAESRTNFWSFEAILCGHRRNSRELESHAPIVQ